MMCPRRPAFAAPNVVDRDAPNEADRAGRSQPRGWSGQLVVWVAKRHEASVDTADGHAHRLAGFVIPRRTPGPVARARDQVGTDRVQVHVGELLLRSCDGVGTGPTSCRFATRTINISGPPRRSRLMKSIVSMRLIAPDEVAAPKSPGSRAERSQSRQSKLSRQKKLNTPYVAHHHVPNQANHVASDEVDRANRADCDNEADRARRSHFAKRSQARAPNEANCAERSRRVK